MTSQESRHVVVRVVFQRAVNEKVWIHDG
jgi:hypothetical protein